MANTRVLRFFVYQQAKQTSEGGSFGCPSGAREEWLKQHGQAWEQSVSS